jgi:hypothetical protein
MKHLRIFKYIDHKSATMMGYSNGGWQFECMPTFDPGVHYTVSHDALEHFTNKEGSIEQECLAFGSMYHIRVLGGYWHHPGSNYFGGHEAEVLADEMSRFLYDANFNVKSVEQIIPEDMVGFCKEFKQCIISDLEQDNKIGDHNKEHIYKAIDNAIKWMCKGVQRSFKRWHGHAPKELCELFMSIANKVSQHAHPYDGQRLYLNFDTQTLEHSVVFS